MHTNSYDKNILKGYNLLLYFAGSMIMNEPSDECIEDFWTQGILKNLPVSSSNPNFVRAASQLRESCVDKNLCGKMLRKDFRRLFKRRFHPLAPSFGSIYMTKRNEIKNHPGLTVTNFYNSYGWGSQIRESEKDDHLATELLFLTILVDKFLVIDDYACRNEMKGEIRRFIDQHILSWVPIWNEKIQLHARTLCYKGIASLIHACVEDLYNLLENNNAAIHPDQVLKNSD